MALPLIPLIGLALTAIGTGTGVVGAIQQGRAQKEAETAQQRLQSIRAARERTQQIRQARIRRAQIEQQGASQGAGESSSVQSGAAGVRQQAFSNIGFINQQVGLGEAVSRARQRGINARGVSALGQGISNLGGTIFANRDEIEDIGANIFS